MKGKRYTTEDKIRLLREADQGEKSIADICREANLSEVTFHRKQPASYSVDRFNQTGFQLAGRSV